MTSTELEYIIKVQDRELKELKKELKGTNDAFGDSEKSGSKWGSRIGKLGGAAKVAGLGIGVAAGGLAWALGKSIEAARESQQVQAQTEAVIKSTGAAAGVTSKQVSDLATKIAMKSGIDDEAIQSGQNLLLTFKNIKNEAGAGNDVFNQTTQIMVDMGVAMGKDASSSAVMLGKALNDPFKGISALSRVGVTFTQSQKDAIAAMVEMGNTAGAQKIILQELQSEFGGSAEAAGKTLTGQMNIAKVAIGNLSEDIGAKLLPAFQKAMQYAIDNWPQIRATIMNAVNGAMPFLRMIWDFIQNTLIPIFQRIAEITKLYWGSVLKIFQQNEPQIKQILGGMKALLQAVGEIIIWLADKVIIPILKPLFMTVLPAALKVTFTVLAAIVGVVGDLKDGFIWLKDNAIKIWNGLKSALVPVFNAVATAIRPVAALLGDIVRFMEGIRDKAGDVVAAADKVAGAVGKIGGLIGKIPGLATGGPVSAGQAYVVGERGPELFIPNQGGTIIPNNALSSASPTGVTSGGGVNVNVYVSGSVTSEYDLAQTIRETLLQIGSRNTTLGLT